MSSLCMCLMSILSHVWCPLLMLLWIYKNIYQFCNNVSILLQFFWMKLTISCTIWYVLADNWWSVFTIFRNLEMTCVMRKQTLRSLTLSYQKKDGARGRAHSSFGMTPTFWEYNLWCQQSQILKSQCHIKRRMGTATQAHPSFGYNDKDLKVCFLVLHLKWDKIMNNSNLLQSMSNSDCNEISSKV